MTSLKTRLEQLDKDLRFRSWLAFERLLESFTDQQLEQYVNCGSLPDPLPQPPPPGMSHYDRLDRKTLIQLWQESELFTARFKRECEGQNEHQISFYLQYGNWPQ
jgi:hypothetical protein